MKRMTFFACVALFAGAAVLTSCKKDNNEPAKAPTVTSDISLSLPGQVGTPLRMPGITVQTDGPAGFAANGIGNIVLIPFAPKAKVTTASTRYGENVIDDGDFSGSQTLSKSVNGRAKVFEGKQVPMGTSAFLFYGKSGADNSNAFSGGQLNAALIGNPSAYSFKLQPIHANVSEIQDVADLFDAYLNGIVNATDENSVVWKNYTVAIDEGYKDIFDTLSSLNVINTFGIERLMTDLYHSLDVNTDSLSRAIRKAILDPTYASLEGSGATSKVKLVAGMQNFPQKFDIPVGAVAVEYNGGAFGNNAAHSYGSLAPASLDRYVYPAQLWYFANTQIKTSTSSKLAAYTGAESWKAILALYEANNATVNTKTRSIALIDTIQYAVARLDVSVKTADGTTLNDNNPVVGLRAIAIPSGGYPLKAVLVGNQKNVGFDFTPGTLSSSDATYGKEYVIYDTIMTAAIAAQPSASSYSAANSTLVLETAPDDGAHGKDVFVALEFLNTGTDFYGIDQQLIPAGSRFYLVGQLSAALATNAGLNERVFVQDFTTVARFSINNLTKAYNTIPDLKAPQLEIGMSVDLTWREGHTYDIVFE